MIVTEIVLLLRTRFKFWIRTSCMCVVSILKMSQWNIVFNIVNGLAVILLVSLFLAIAVT